MQGGLRCLDTPLAFIVCTSRKVLSCKPRSAIHALSQLRGTYVVHIVWLRCLIGMACLWHLLMLSSQAAVSVNLPLDDPVYPLLERLVHSRLTTATALTLKPITRLYAAQLIGEALERRQQALEAQPGTELFLDEILETLVSRFKRELQDIGALSRLQRRESFVFAPLNEIKLEPVFASQPLVLRDRSGLTRNLQGVFGNQEGFAYGDDFTLRARTLSWATLGDYAAVYLEPEIIIRSQPLLGESIFEAGLHKGYIKAGYANLELTFGRDTLWWGPASQDDLVLSNNAPPLNLIKLATPRPFRLPGPYHDLGEWQLAYAVARLEAQRDFPHALLSALRLTYQPATFVKFGYTNAFQAFGRGGVRLDALEYATDIFVPTLDTTGRTINGLTAYDVVVSVPLVRAVPFLHGLHVYWQRGHDNARRPQGLLGGANILGGVLDGERWDVRFEYSETRDTGPVWYTHPTYNSGFALRHFVLGSALGGAAQGYWGRATYYLTPTAWMAADGRYEQYGFATTAGVASQQRFGLEASYQFPWQQGFLTLWGRVEYATLETPDLSHTRTVNMHLSTRWRF